jgi:PIH1 N-terminal domain
MSAQISLAPRPGFCVKSRVVKETIVHQNSNSIPVPSGSKIFINIAWDKNVNPPPHTTEESIQQALSGLGDWSIPVIISDLRQDVDKGC